MNTTLRLVTTNDCMLNTIWEVVEESSTNLTVTPYPQQGRDRPLSIIPKSRAIPYAPQSTWHLCDCTVQHINGHDCLVTMLSGKNVVVAVFSPGFRLRLNEQGKWQPEQEELHVSR